MLASLVRSQQSNTGDLSLVRLMPRLSLKLSGSHTTCADGPNTFEYDRTKVQAMLSEASAGGDYPGLPSSRVVSSTRHKMYAGILRVNANRSALTDVFRSLVNLFSTPQIASQFLNVPIGKVFPVLTAEVVVKAPPPPPTPMRRFNAWIESVVEAQNLNPQQAENQFLVDFADVPRPALFDSPEWIALKAAADAPPLPPLPPFSPR